MILVTGANGFIGSAAVRELARRGRAVRAAMRASHAPFPPNVQTASISDLTNPHEWLPLLNGIDSIVHTAARVHHMVDRSADPLAEFRKVNVTGTLALARVAAACGVKRFVFLSSIKVNGESTDGRGPFTSEESSTPSEPYGRSKLEAERGLQDLSRTTGLEVTIIRPVLVYGPGVRANFRSMLHWLQRGVPLPLGAIDNRRSLVALDNLVDLIITCLDHPGARNRTFLASDGQDFSTTELLRCLADGLRRPARLLPVPAGVLRAAARALGKAEAAKRLCGSLQVDISDTCRELNWNPPRPAREALTHTATWFRDEAHV